MQEELTTLIALSEKEHVTDREKEAILFLINMVVGGSAEVAETKQKTKFTDDDMKLAEWMAKRVNQLLGREKKHNLKSWANTIRLMREQDKLTLTDIGAAFDFANKHHFWAKNILSPDKLRKQYDKLKLEANSNTPTKSVVQTKQRLSPSERFRQKAIASGKPVNF